MRHRSVGIAAALVVGAVVLADAIEDRPVEALAGSKLAAACPTQLLPLGENPVAAASRVALRGERRQDRPRVTGAVVATLAFDRSRHVAQNCGRRVAARSVVVTGWKVWDVLH